MYTPLLSFAISSTLLIAMLVMFSHERRRGKRYLDNLRSHLDFYLLKIRHSFNMGIRNWGRYFIRQILHYFVHTLLTGAIRSLATIEERLKTVARSNRALARKSERERTTMNKLEEVALHKLEMTLTDEEKRIRRHESLER
jgi:hypothetical protein